jgi:CRP-like cAMP-binding protein
MATEIDRTEIISMLKTPPRFRYSTFLDTLMKLTEKIPFFSAITKDQHSSDIHKECCSALALAEYSANDVIIHFGDPGDSFFIILTGQVSVMIPSNQKMTVSKAEIGTTQALNSLSSSSSLSLSSDISLENINAAKERRPGIRAINATEIISKLKKENISLIREIENDKTADNEEKAIIRIFRDKLIKEKKELIRVIRSTGKELIEIEIDNLEEVGVLGQDDTFGELALITDRPRAATIIAKENTSLLVLNKENFKQILGAITERKIIAKVRALQAVPFFQAWSKRALTKVSYMFQTQSYRHKQLLFAEGQPTTGIFLIKNGEFAILKRVEASSSPNSPVSHLKEPEKVATKRIRFLKKFRTIQVIIKGKNESVGGFELFSHKPRQFSCICVSSTGEVYFIPKEIFLSKIPNFDSIKTMIEDDNRRLEEQSQKACHFETNTLLASPTLVLTPDLKKRRFCTPRSKYLKIHKEKTAEVIFPSLHGLSSFTAKKKSPSLFRKLTESEIAQAINGRTSVVRQYPHLSYLKKHLTRSPKLSLPNN